MEPSGYNLKFGPIDPVLLSPDARASTSQPVLWEHSMTLDHAAIQTIQVATHIQLIKHNQDHQGLYASYMALKGKYEQLSASYDQLNDSLKVALSKPQQQPESNSESSGCRQLPDLPKPSQSDYPGIRFWTHHQYTQWKKNKSDKSNVVDPTQSPSHRRRGSAHLASTGENVQMEFIEEQDGTIVNGSRAASIRDSARRLLAQMKKDSAKLPGKWQQADMYQKGYVLQALYHDYPYLSLCENHWKANLVVSHVLSGEVSKGKRKDKLKEPATKTEQVEAGALYAVPNVSAGPSGSKQSVSPSSPVVQQTPKRVRLYSISPCPSPHKTPEEPLMLAPPAVVTNPAEHNNGLELDSGIGAAGVGEANPAPVTAVDPVAEPETAPTAPVLSGAGGSQDSELKESSASRDDSEVCDGANADDNMSADTVLGDLAEPEHASVLEDHSDGAVSPALVAAEPLVLVNPLTAVFGPERVPSARMDNMQAKTEKKTEKGKKRGGRKKGIKENVPPTNEGPSNDGSTLPEISAVSTSSAPSPPLKRVTASKSAKNLFYIDYLSTHEPLTVEAFEALWKTLSKDEIKKWTAAGKASRYVLEPIEGEEANAKD